MALSDDFNTAYDRFMTAWLDHQQLRRSGDFAEIVTSKQRVDDLRLQMRAQMTLI